MTRTIRLAGFCAAALAFAGAAVVADVTPGGRSMDLIGMLTCVLTTAAVAFKTRDNGRRFGMAFSDFDKACRYLKGN